MDVVLAALQAQLDELGGLLDPLDAEGWTSPSPCPGWDVAAVVLHLAQTNEMATASARGALAESGREWSALPGDNVDESAGAAVEAERNAPASVIHDRWRASAADMVEAFAACDGADRLLWVAGDIAARTLATTRIAETWIHTEDVAIALGVALSGTDRLWHIARLVHRTVPYAFDRAGESRPGAIRFDLTAPDGGDRWTFGDESAPTAITGPALDLCRVAGQRLTADATDLVGTGPDADRVLALMRTFA